LQALFTPIWPEQTNTGKSIEQTPGVRPSDTVVSAVPTDRKSASAQYQHQDRTQKQNAGQNRENDSFTGQSVANGGSVHWFPKKLDGIGVPTVSEGLDWPANFP
jgi:hypothetical protein